MVIRFHPKNALFDFKYSSVPQLTLKSKKLLLPFFTPYVNHHEILPPTSIHLSITPLS